MELTFVGLLDYLSFTVPVDSMCDPLTSLYVG